jgi:hypothetical protein
LLQSVFLVGGFSASQYLYDSLKSAIKIPGLIISRPDCHVCVYNFAGDPYALLTTPSSNKAVAEGAAYFYLDRRVNIRVARFTYGLEVTTDYCPFLPGHYERRSNTFVDLDGTKRLMAGFSTLLAKVFNANSNAVYIYILFH